MSKSQSLHLKQSQNMVMTQNLRQAIEMLQLNSVELAEFVSDHVEKNPFLTDGDSDVENSHDKKQDFKSNEDVRNLTDSVGGKQEGSWSDDEVSPAVYEDDNLKVQMNISSGSKYNDSNYNLENEASPKGSLKDLIIDQINIDIKEHKQKVMALYLTDLLDENGYLLASIDEVAKVLKCESAELFEVVEILQSFEPAGVFARDLTECLKLQLKDKNHLDPAIELMLENLDLLAGCELEKLRKICDVSEEDFNDMVAEIKTLNPKPGRDFINEVTEHVQPDVFLKKDEKGEFFVELNNDALPKVLVNQKYYSSVEKEAKDKDSKKFVSEQMAMANWLVKALDQRANTILKISRQIVKNQKDFFRKGIVYLKPMVLNDIASDIEMHESTVSRVINGKYMATDMGLFELKYFFSSGLSANSSSGEGVSSKSVKHLIAKMIEEEDPKKVLSDDKIAKMLQVKGVDVARRTVAKYREAMGIATSSVRKREKKLKLGLG